jgi:hypothetical protein
MVHGRQACYVDGMRESDCVLQYTLDVRRTPDLPRVACNCFVQS